MEADFGFQSLGEIEGIGIEGEIIRGWIKRRGQRPLLRVKCIRNEEYRGDEERQGEWQTKADLAIPEEVLQTWGRSTQERIGNANGWWSFINFII